MSRTTPESAELVRDIVSDIFYKIDTLFFDEVGKYHKRHDLSANEYINLVKNLNVRITLSMVFRAFEMTNCPPDVQIKDIYSLIDKGTKLNLAMQEKSPDNGQGGDLH